MVVVALAVGLAACQPQPTAFPEPPAAVAPMAAAPAAAATAPVAAAPSSPPPADVVPAAHATAIRATIDAVNSAAGGPVAGQQAQLIAHVDPARRDAAQRCPIATSTVRLEPVEQGLRPLAASPDGAAGTAPPSGTEMETGTDGTGYALPTLIRIFSGERLIGTDLTTLRLIVRHTETGDEAFLTPFCVN